VLAVSRRRDNSVEKINDRSRSLLLVVSAVGGALDGPLFFQPRQINASQVLVRVIFFGSLSVMSLTCLSAHRARLPSLLLISQVLTAIISSYVQCAPQSY